MYIDNMTITAFVVFAVAMVMFVKKCFIMSCIIKTDSEAGIDRDVEPGDKK
jgi:hypothetical protein